MTLVSGLAGDAARAEAAPLCALGDGPAEYQSKLGPLLSTPGPLPPAPPPPPAPTSRSAVYPSVGAGALAREALGAQFTMLWVNNVVQGWVVGLAPGALDVEQARTRIVDALAPHFTPADHAYLAERLHVDPQPYSETELRATQAQVDADLTAASIPASRGYGACRLSDAIRVEVTL